MVHKLIELVTGSLEEKKQYRQLKARLDALPEPYAGVAKALQRYFMYQGGVVDGGTLVAMMEGSVELWERAAADGSAVRDIVGDDPVEFAETFAESYAGTRWIDKERARLSQAVEHAEHAQRGDR